MRRAASGYRARAPGVTFSMISETDFVVDVGRLSLLSHLQT